MRKVMICLACNTIMAAAYLLQGEVLVKTVPAGEGKKMFVTKNLTSTRLRTGFFDIQTAVSRKNPHIMKYLPYKIADKCLEVIPHVKEVLILGLGGGSFAHVILKKYAGAMVTAVDINPALPDLARKYFGLPEKAKTVISGAAEFLAANERQYDMIFLDVFEGRKTPESIVNEKFFSDLAMAVSPEGIVLMNTIRSPFRGKKHDEIVQLFKMSFRYHLQLRDWPGKYVPVNSELVGTASTIVFDKISKSVNDKKISGRLLPVVRVQMN